MLRRIFPFVFGCAFFAPTCQADMILGFSVDEGQTFSNTITVNPGELVVFDIYARELNPTNTLSTEGLSNMGTRATFNNEYGSVTSVAVTNSSFNFLPDAGFDNGLGELSFTAGTLGAVSGADILMGRVEFSALSPGTTEFLFGDWDPFLSDMVSGIGTDLDSLFFNDQLTGTHQFSITAVPEPSSVVLCSLGLSLFLLNRRGRWSKRHLSSSLTVQASTNSSHSVNST